MCQAVIDLEKTKSRFLLNKNSSRLWTFFSLSPLFSSFGAFLTSNFVIWGLLFKAQINYFFQRLSFLQKVKIQFWFIPSLPHYYPFTATTLFFIRNPLHPPNHLTRPPDLRLARSSHLIRYLMLIKYNFEKV